jgi:hypothetical protein
VSALLWSLYTVVIGSFTGAWFPHAPLLAAALGVVLAVLVGIAGDVIARHRRNAVARRGQDAVCLAKTSLSKTSVI